MDDRICRDLLVTDCASAGATDCGFASIGFADDVPGALVFACDAGTGAGAGAALGAGARRELALSPCRRITLLEYCRLSFRSETKPCLMR